MLEKYREGKWLTAVSGGPDSMALLYLCEKEGITFSAAHVNYHHRPEAEEEEAYVRAYCAEHGIELFVRNESFEYSGNFEASARDWRYTWFAQIAEKYGFSGVLTAHHQDDLIETYVMQKEKDLTPEYYGIQEQIYYKDLGICRPLLSLTKADLIRCCESAGIRYYTDKTNRDVSYTRNRIRHEVIDGLTVPQRQEILAEISRKNHELQKIRTDADHLIDHGRVNLKNYRACEEEVRLQILRTLADTEIHRSKAQYREIDSQIMNKDDFMIPLDERYFCQDRGRFFLEIPGQPYEYIYNSLEELHGRQKYFGIERGTPGVYAVTLNEEDYPVTIRSYLPGDMIRMRFGTKKVHRFFIDRHIPLYQRSLWPVMVNRKGEVILVSGLGCDIKHYSILPTVTVVQYLNSDGGIPHV